MNIEPVRPSRRQAPVGEPVQQADLPPLTRNQAMVYQALLDLGRAAKAYELLDILRAQGVKAAPTVYRALHELQDKGLVQHVLSNRTFFALEQPDQQHRQKLLLVCDECGETRLIKSNSVLSALKSNARASGFVVQSYHLEISTDCKACDCAGQTAP